MQANAMQELDKHYACPRPYMVHEASLQKLAMGLQTQLQFMTQGSSP